MVDVLRSMTGYGSGEADLGTGRLLVELRAVNHRFLDVRLRLPTELADHAAVVEELVRKRLDRGRIEVMSRQEGTGRPAPALDVARAKAMYTQLCELRDELNPDEPVPLSLLASVPDLFVTRGGPPPDELRRALLAAAGSACKSLDVMRDREGEALADDLSGRLERLRAHLAQVRGFCPKVVESHRQRLRERLERLLVERAVDLDPGRLEHEVALFADKSDVAEEVARLAAHCDQFGELMQEASGLVGRRLDFLLQEMAREANTLGSKSPEVEMTRLVIELKADVERMREQVQNVL